MKKKLLLTGSAGFCQGNLIRKLIYENKYDIISIDKIAKSSLMNNIYNKSHQFYLADICDEHIMNVIFEYERPDFIIHGAEENEISEKIIKSNQEGTKTLINISEKWGVKKFIHLSTSKIYKDLENESAQTSKEDDDICFSKDVYINSKIQQEKILKSSNLDYCIVRSSNNYGPRQPKEKFIPNTIRCILENKRIPVYGEGKQIRDWLHVFDNCSAIMKILENGKAKETYNISANQEFSNIEVIYRICKVMEKGLDLVEFIKDDVGHNFRSALNSNKLRELGWEPRFKFKDGIKQNIEWYINNRFYLKG